MRLIDRLTTDARQRYTLVAEDGEEIDLLLWYAPSQQGWMMDVTAGSFTVEGVQLVNAPNIMRIYRNFINFGFTITVNDGLDPYYLDDFVSGRVKFYLLTAAEVEQIEARLFE